jgi:CHAD domain
MESPSPSNAPVNEPAQEQPAAARTRRRRTRVSRDLSTAPIQVFAKGQLDERLTRVEKEWERCTANADEAAIHDFRVSLRRFGEGLWLFRRLFPKTERRQVRKELRGVMRLSARVRDVDIVMGSFVLANVTVSPEIRLFLENERSIAEAAFNAALAVGLRTTVGRRWRATLSLSRAAAPTDEVTPEPSGPAEPTCSEPEAGLA